MIYNNDTLIKYCFENNIELLDNYKDIKINREHYVKGVCKTKIETCDKIFNKNFRQLVKTGPYCYNCAVENGKQKYKLKCKYNLQYLLTFCDENNIVLNEDYSNQFIDRNTMINGNCLTNECNECFSRTFRELVKINGYCFECSKNNGKLKIIKTNLEKFGCLYSMQNETVKEKQKQTVLEKYGVEHILQLESIQEKIKIKNLEKYGVEYSLQSKIVRDKGIETCKLKYGVENPQQNTDIKNKTMDTNLLRYGHKSVIKNPIIKQKMIESNIIKYGVPHHSQNPEVSEHMFKCAYHVKQYTTKSGKIIDYQGYENFAFDELLNVENILEDDIITSRKDVPVIWYKDKTNKLRRHFVDIYIKSQNRCIEVKSTWTNQERNHVVEKQAAAIELGYNYERWVFDKNGNMLEKY